MGRVGPGEGSCRSRVLNLMCGGAIKFSSNVLDVTSKVIDAWACSGSPYQTVCVTCTSFDGYKISTCASLGGGVFVRADANADGVTDISDAVAILGYLFLGADQVPCEQAGDSNDDGALDISDAVNILSFLFLGGKSIGPPIENCGIDPTEHGLTCNRFPGCQ